MLYFVFLDHGTEMFSTLFHGVAASELVSSVGTAIESYCVDG